MNIYYNIFKLQCELNNKIKSKLLIKKIKNGKNVKSFFVHPWIINFDFKTTCPTPQTYIWHAKIVHNTIQCRQKILNFNLKSRELSAV